MLLLVEVSAAYEGPLGTWQELPLRRTSVEKQEMMSHPPLVQIGSHQQLVQQTFRIMKQEG